MPVAGCVRVGEGVSRFVVNGRAEFTGGGEIIVFVNGKIKKVYRGGREIAGEFNFGRVVVESTKKSLKVDLSVGPK